MIGQYHVFVQPGERMGGEFPLSQEHDYTQVSYAVMICETRTLLALYINAINRCCLSSARLSDPERFL